MRRHRRSGDNRDLSAGPDGPREGQDCAFPSQPSRSKAMSGRAGSAISVVDRRVTGVLLFLLSPCNY